MPIIWQANMSVGSKHIDDEHKYLFALCNCVELALKTGDLSSIDLFLGQLQEYCQEHFTNEEKLQLRIKYPYYLENKTQHLSILEDLQQLRERLLKKESAETGQPTVGDAADYDPDATDPEPSGDDAEQSKTTASGEVLDAAMVKEISTLMRKWILDHVLVVDRKMHSFLSRIPPSKRKDLLGE